MTASALPDRVLLVEDDTGDALLVRECLLDAGVADRDVVWRRTLADGIAALVDQPGCVLLDLGLPDAEGLAALHQLVSQAGDIPVIVLTGRNDRVGVQAVGAGAQDYLIKDDVTTELLDRSIRYAVERRRAQAAELRLRAEQVLAAENVRLERGLLPKPLLRSDLVACVSLYRPGRDRAVLGGDFFDVVETEDGRIRAIIGDVMGHGPDEAALGVALRVAWRALVLAGVDEEQILKTLSELLFAESGGGTFVTVCELTIERDRTAVVRVAGHPPPLLCSRDGAAYLDVEISPPLGIGAPSAHWPDGPWRPHTRTRLPIGASLLLYTDGLLDAYRSRDDRLSVGIEELLAAAAVASSADERVSTWIPSIVRAAPVRSEDDTAIVVLTPGGPR